MKISRKQTRKLILQEIKKERFKRRKYIEFCDIILKENQVLLENKKYLSQTEINEGFFDTIMSFGGSYLGNLFPGFIGGIKQSIASNVIKSLGLNPASAFGRILKNIFDELKLKDFQSMISNWSKDGCKLFIDTILRALSDALQEYLLERFFGVPKDADLSGIALTAREAFTGTVNGAIIPSVSKMIEKAICGLEMNQIVTKVKQMAAGGGDGLVDTVKGSIGKQATPEEAQAALGDAHSVISKQFNMAK